MREPKGLCRPQMRAAQTFWDGLFSAGKALPVMEKQEGHRQRSRDTVSPFFSPLNGFWMSLKRGRDPGAVDLTIGENFETFSSQT